MAARAFEGIRVIDTTHVLAGPFAAYQLAVLGADVIKVESPHEPDQTRGQGADPALRQSGMATTFLAQASNKRCITLDLKQPAGRDLFRRLVAGADILVENYRPGAFDALGLGYRDLSALNPRLIYCSISAFGANGPRGGQTAYDVVIQATSGLMAATGTEAVNPVRIGSPVVDYATGTAGAFAMASALFQRERTGRGQHIDLAMADVAKILMGAQITSYSYGRHHPHPMGNRHFSATIGCYDTKDGLLMLAAANHRQQVRLWQALGRPDMIKTDEGEKLAARRAEMEVLEAIFPTRTAAEWEEFLQGHHVPAGRVRDLVDSLADPQQQARGTLHHHAPCAGVDHEFTVPVAAFQLAEGSPAIDTPPHQHGADTDAVLAELGLSAGEIGALRTAGAI